MVKTKPEFIVIEDLSIKGMKEANNDYSKEIQKLSWYEISNQLEYKSMYHNIPFIKVDRYYPSTKTCSQCGWIKEMSLQDRVYKCPHCGLVIDRDLNAAINILRLGLQSVRIKTVEA